MHLNLETHSSLEDVRTFLVLAAGQGGHAGAVPRNTDRALESLPEAPESWEDWQPSNFVGRHGG